MSDGLDWVAFTRRTHPVWDSNNLYIAKKQSTVAVPGPMSLTGKLMISPNPATDRILISTSLRGCLSILDVNGTEVLRQEVRAPDPVVLTDMLAPGIYFLRMSGSGGNAMGKFVKL